MSLIQASNAKTKVKQQITSLKFDKETRFAIKAYIDMRSAWENFTKEATQTNEAFIVVLNDAVIYIHKS